MNDNWLNSRQYRVDPLPGVKPALLNSEDIIRYVKAGCLIEEQDFDQSRVKTASYELRFLGHLYYWEHTPDGGVERRCECVTQGNPVNIAKNSITYLWTRECLYLPEYIAARFNLRIRHVHRGILLGTGPLVDPGFGGRILIPLHNLTDNDYELIGGEGIVWVDFTKISMHRSWLPKFRESRGRLVEFPTEKIIDNPHEYFSKAHVTASTGVRSAFKGVLKRTEDATEEARQQADEARQEAGRLRNRTWMQLFVGVAALFIALFGIWIGSVDVLSRAIDKIQMAYEKADEEASSLDRMRIDNLTREVQKLRADIDDMRKSAMRDGGGMELELDPDGR